MPTAIHSFSQEEMMAYLDGELSADRALAAAQHLEHCRECQRLAADFQNVSRRLLDWEVNPLESSAPQAEANDRPKPILWRRPWILGVCSLAVLVVIVAALTRSVGEYARAPMNSRPQFSRMEPPLTQNERIMSARTEARGMGVVGGTGVIGGVVGGAPAPPPVPVPLAPATPLGPLIVRTARLTVTSKNFDESRTELERIVRTHQGYISQLQSNTPAVQAVC